MDVSSSAERRTAANRLPDPELLSEYSCKLTSETKWSQVLCEGPSSKSSVRFSCLSRERFRTARPEGAPPSRQCSSPLNTAYFLLFFFLLPSLSPSHWPKLRITVAIHLLSFLWPLSYLRSLQVPCITSSHRYT